MLTGRWFRALAPEFQEALLKDSVERALAPGETLFLRGADPCGLYAVLEGAIRVAGSGESGKEALLTLMEPPNWFGEISVFDGLPRTHDAVAATRARVLQVPQDRLAALLEKSPQFWRELGLLLSHKLRLAFVELEGAALLPASVRLARRLVTLAEGHGDLHAHSRRVLKVPQDQLAAMLSISRQTTNALLKELAETGAVRLTYGEIEIVDLGALKSLAQG